MLVTHTSSTRFWINTQGQDVVEVKSMIDLVLVKKDMLCFVHDVSTVRGVGRGISDHHVVLRKVKSVGTCIKGRDLEDKVGRLEVRN